MYIICDQFGNPFTEEDCQKFEDKQVKKIGKINNGFLCLPKKEDDEIIQIDENTFKLFCHIKDKNEKIKITDYYIVRGT